MNINEIKTPCIAIVKLMDGTQNPAVMFQVTIDPRRVSPSGALIRFENADSEIHGWKDVSSIEIVEILEEVERD